TTKYYPERVNRKDGAALTGTTRDVDHMANWIECVRTRKQPNANVDIGYRSAVAAHMANLAYRKKERISLETARAINNQAQLSLPA
ncbi:MAG TPA: hypothetical protein VF493_17105, partial [Terriglobales bacterium]